MNSICNEIIGNYQKRVLGFIFVTITPLSVLLGLPSAAYNHPGWWHSVSQTFYAYDNIIMIGMLAVIAILSITHRCKFYLERFTFIFLGITTLGVLFFPHGETVFEYAGIFHLKNSVSGILHVIFAILFFSDFAIISIKILGKEDKTFTPTEKSELRKKIYKINGIIILIADICLAVRQALGIEEFAVIIFEFFTFTPFGINLLIKANLIKSLND